MSNIMLTYRCNLNCSYCFANEYVNRKSLDITPDDFSRALDFSTSSGDRAVGLIGGEPTLHKNMGMLLERIIKHKNIQRARYACLPICEGLQKQGYNVFCRWNGL